MLNIDVFSDVVCPWCFIGKRHLDAALDQLRHDGANEVAVTWRAFQLNPQLPREGISRQSYIETKFGGAERAAAIYQRVAQAGRGAGIEFAFERIQRQPNTLNAHRLIHRARESGAQDAMVTRLFEAYFLEGADLTDNAVLSALAAQAGMRLDEVRSYLDSDADAQQIHADDAQARDAGIQGVPFFIFAGRHAVSGAQPPQALLQVMRRVLRETEVTT